MIHPVPSRKRLVQINKYQFYIGVEYCKSRILKFLCFEVCSIVSCNSPVKYTSQSHWSLLKQDKFLEEFEDKFCGFTIKKLNLQNNKHFSEIDIECDQIHSQFLGFTRRHKFYWRSTPN